MQPLVWVLSRPCRCVPDSWEPIMAAPAFDLHGTVQLCISPGHAVVSAVLHHAICNQGHHRQGLGQMDEGGDKR